MPATLLDGNALLEMVKEGRIGQKSGAGFYRKVKKSDDAREPKEQVAKAA